MSDYNLTRERLMSLIATTWTLGILAIFATFVFWPPPPPPSIEVVHWANAHMMRKGLLPDMARQFNQDRHKTESGKLIVVNVLEYGSAPIAADLQSRVQRSVPLDPKLPNPVIVTTQADHWLISLNQAAGRVVVDPANIKSIARTWIGIVTYRDMAECLGWPNKEIGYADIIALREDPRGWASQPCAKAEWGQRPLVGFTDPASSTTGRSVLYTLYSVAAGKSSQELTLVDVKDPKVISYVKRFQRLVDHYQTGTIPLNTKVYQGPAYGHFFLMPEDNLFHLYQGTETVMDSITGKPFQAPPISRPMVMIYPNEGSTEHNHSAGLVQAPWVTPEHSEAAQKWTAFLLEDDRQMAFMKAGFRPATALPLGDPISGKYGLDPTKPTAIVNPDRISPEAAEGIVNAWQEVKKPGIVTFVVDTSGSMLGTKLDQAKDGLIRALDGMAKNNQVGLVTFDTAVNTRVPVAPLNQNRFQLANSVRSLREAGQTALYDAIKTGVEMADAASGDEDAIRGVVVLTDGKANTGRTALHDLIWMMSRNEVAIWSFAGFENDTIAKDERGANVAKEEIIGVSLALQTRHRIQIFFIGIGNGADMQIGRMLAEATQAEFQGVADKDLAKVLEEFGKYF
jgi:Ca-activated chloride channel homolog